MDAQCTPLLMGTSTLEKMGREERAEEKAKDDVCKEKVAMCMVCMEKVIMCAWKR